LLVFYTNYKVKGVDGTYGSYCIAENREEAINILEWRGLGEELNHVPLGVPNTLVRHDRVSMLSDPANSLHQVIFLASTITNHPNYLSWIKKTNSDKGLMHELVHMLVIKNYVEYNGWNLFKEYEELIRMTRGFFYAEE
jgi:hypothetical protein